MAALVVGMTMIGCIGVCSIVVPITSFLLVFVVASKGVVAGIGTVVLRVEGCGVWSGVGLL